MALERTLSIIKPDAVAKNVIGQIIARFEAAGLQIVAARMMHLSRAEAEGFYAVHAARPFFKDLVEFMTSGPVMIQVLEGENAIAKNRELMGATDPKKAAQGTIRADFARSIDANAVHGSDGAETARDRDRVLLPRGEMSATAESTRRVKVNLLGLRRRGPRALLRGAGREAVSRAPGAAAGSTSAASRDFDAMTDLAKALREKLAGDRERRRAARSSATAPPPTARASGCSNVDGAQRRRDGVHPRDDRGTLCIS